MGNIERDKSKFSIMTIPNRENRKLSPTFSNLKLENILSTLQRGKIDSETYVLLFLYNGLDSASQDSKMIVDYLFAEYGAKINNRLKDIPLFTVYSKEVFEKWKTNLIPSIKTTIEEQFESIEDSQVNYKMMIDLARSYQLVGELPALVVISTKPYSSPEFYFSISFKNYINADQIYKKMCEVFSAIEEHPNNIDLVKADVKKAENSFRANIQEITAKRFWEKVLAKTGKSKQEIAKDLQWDRNTLSKYFNGEQSIKVDRVFDIASYFNFSKQELQILWSFSDASPKEREEWEEGSNRYFEEKKKRFR